MIACKVVPPQRRFSTSKSSPRFQSKLLQRISHLRRVDILLLLLHSVVCIFIGLRLHTFLDSPNSPIYTLSSLPTSAPASLSKLLPPTDPCHGRPPPTFINVSAAQPPTLYFLHIPKTAGTLMYQLVLQYANKTNGLACQFLYDGNRWGIHEYQIAPNPPPYFPDNSISSRAVQAFYDKNSIEKAYLYKQGACRAVRGHVTYTQRDELQAPQVSLTVLRHPIERFISMYEFVHMMVRTRPGTSGWDQWLDERPLEDELRNASSIVNLGFYDESGEWIAKGNVGFSFHFYGVLHQLSGLTPRFEGVGDPQRFGIANARAMAEKAKDNICSTHILGLQSDVPFTLDTFFEVMEPFAQWSHYEQDRAKRMSTNVNLQRSSQNVRDYLSDNAYAVLEKRLKEEIEVYEFAERVIEYRRKASAAVEMEG